MKKKTWSDKYKRWITWKYKLIFNYYIGELNVMQNYPHIPLKTKYKILKYKFNE